MWTVRWEHLGEIEGVFMMLFIEVVQGLIDVDLDNYSTTTGK